MKGKINSQNCPEMKHLSNNKSPELDGLITEPLGLCVACYKNDIFDIVKEIQKKNTPELRTFESIATEHIICLDKLVLAPNFYYSLAAVTF